MNTRALSLDALRGFAIIIMVLSGSMYMADLPAWMAHAQVPPGKGFDPSIYGITWVDLVFPFFLFSMGAAFPFSIGRKIDNGIRKPKLYFDIVLRGIFLGFFAIFYMHLHPLTLGQERGITSSLLSLSAFALMFPMFMHIDVPKLKNTKYASAASWTVKILAFVAAFILMKVTYYEKAPHEFSPYRSDIILMVLANMALFGSIIYSLTWKKPVARMGVLVVLAAVFLAGKGGEGWVKDVFDYSPLPWAYRFDFLKYLIIVLPGSIAGDYLYQWINKRKSLQSEEPKNNPQAIAMVILPLLLIISNVALLFARHLILNLVITAILLVICYLVLKKQSNSFSTFWKQLFTGGAFCLLVGLILESYQGGIRKDDATFSYFFVTAGLAFFMLMLLSSLCDYFKCARSTKFLVMSGQNPMVAYTSLWLVVMPILTITHLKGHLDIFYHGAFLGFLQGVFLTTLCVLITMFFTYKKWFWRT